jgi:hypothetical protein
LVVSWRAKFWLSASTCLSGREEVSTGSGSGRALAHAHGNVWNGSEFGRAFGVAHTTVLRYLDLLSPAFVVRQLPPWSENLAKRQVKSPKVYVADSGVLHTLLDIGREADLVRHPKVGALVVRGSLRLGFELKRTVAPSVTPSMRIARESLRHAGDRTGDLAKGIRAVALERLLEDLAPLG